MIIKLSTQDWFQIILMTFTVLLVCLYVYAYVIASKNHEGRYIQLLITARTLILASFLLYFYNPLRSEFEYGRSLPFFAFSAGLSLIFLLDRFEILNLVHFILYRELLPENPVKQCKLVEAGVPEKNRIG
jgi:hypothetical protein